MISIQDLIELYEEKTVAYDLEKYVNVTNHQTSFIVRGISLQILNAVSCKVEELSFKNENLMSLHDL